jgi:hypothetical protein
MNVLMGTRYRWNRREFLCRMGVRTSFMDVKKHAAVKYNEAVLRSELY